MGNLSDDLREMGYMPTGESSPVDDDGMLWSNSHELVCDATGVVIDGDHHTTEEDDGENHVYRYRNSKQVKLIGGFTSSYDWGYDDESEFRY